MDLNKTEIEYLLTKVRDDIDNLRRELARCGDNNMIPNWVIDLDQSVLHGLEFFELKIQRHLEGK